MSKFFSSKHVNLFIHILAIYAIYLSNSVIQEKISTKSYEENKFKSPLFITAIQSLGSLILSSRKYKGESFAVIKMFVFLSALSIATTILTFHSLSYMNYPSLVLTRSCKLIPIALLNYLIFKKVLSKHQSIVIILTTLSVLLFTMNSSILIPSKVTFTPYALLFIVGSLFLDGLINSLQDYVFAKYQVLSSSMMFHCNFFKLLFSLAIILSNGEFKYSCDFISRSPRFLVDVAVTSTFSCIGQMVIYSMIKKHGSLTLSFVNVTRKIFTILISLAYYKHSLSTRQWFGVAGVIISTLIGMIPTDKKVKND